MSHNAFFFFFFGLRETKEKEVELWMVIRGVLGFLWLRRGTSQLCNRYQVSWILSFLKKKKKIGGVVWWLRKWGKIFGDGDLELGFLVICDVG